VNSHSDDSNTNNNKSNSDEIVKENQKSEKTTQTKEDDVNKSKRNKYNNFEKNKMNYGNKEKSIETFEQYKSKHYHSLNKDLPLKYLTKLLFNSMGYYCELEINIFTESFNQKYKKEQISDIDVLGVRIESDLNIDCIPVECKSGKDGALDELLKLKGIIEYFNSHKGYLIKSKIANNAREMGEKINISTIDQEEIRKLLSNIGLLNISDQKWISIQLDNYLREKYICERAINFTRALEYLKNEYWTYENYRNIHNIIFLFSNQKDSLIYSTDEGRYTLIKLAINFSISLLRLSSYIIHKNFNNPINKVKEYIFGGAREKRDREVLFDKINQTLSVNGNKMQKFEPDYIDDITELCISLISSPNNAKRIPICFEYYLNAYILKNVGFCKDEISKEFTNITLKLAKDIIVFICKQSKTERKNFEDLFNI
jgi:hypothetical protein